jgi:hypothetical protein
MTRDRKLMDADTQRNKQQQQNVPVVSSDGGADRPQLSVGATVESSGDRAACLATVYSYLLHRRARRLSAHADDRGTGDAAQEDGGPSESKQSQQVDRAA